MNMTFFSHGCKNLALPPTFSPLFENFSPTNCVYQNVCKSVVRCCKHWLKCDGLHFGLYEGYFILSKMYYLKQLYSTKADNISLQTCKPAMDIGDTIITTTDVWCILLSSANQNFLSSRNLLFFVEEDFVMTQSRWQGQEYLVRRRMIGWHNFRKAHSRTFYRKGVKRS